MTKIVHYKVRLVRDRTRSYELGEVRGPDDSVKIVRKQFVRPNTVSEAHQGGRRTVELYNLFYPRARNPTNGYLVRVVVDGSTRFVKFGAHEDQARAFARGEIPEPTREDRTPRPETARDTPPKSQAVSATSALTGSLDDMIKNALARYPVAGPQVDGLQVRDHVPNLGSIDGFISDDQETLPGIRVVPMSDFGDPHSVFYAADDFERSERLAEAIRELGEINPLIVGIDEKGPFIIEGAHRFVALHYLKVNEFPAVVVVGVAGYSAPGALTDPERRILEDFNDDIGAPSGLVA